MWAGAQTYALDTGFLIEEFIRSQGVLPRGLAHPIIFGVCATYPLPCPRILYLHLNLNPDFPHVRGHPRLLSPS